MDKSPDAFRTISEAAEELDLPQHVLRFWETRFTTIKPLKRGGGRRYYRPDDVMLLKGIRHLLYDQGFTIKGVQRILKEQGPRHVIAIAEAGGMETIAPSGAGGDLPSLAAPDPDGSYPDAPAVLPQPDGGPRRLSADDRERLTGVLRELLDCKRALERARE